MNPDAEQHVFDLGISGSGTINDVTFDVQGRGVGNTATGEFSFEVTFSDIARDTDPFANLLGVLILPTGAFGREIENARGLMTLAGGVFEFSQLIAGEGIQVRSTGNISRVNAREFVWNSHAEGVVKLKQVSAIEPLQVVMLPQGAGKLTEVISLPLIEQGRRIIAQSVRHFTFTPGAELKQLQLRHALVKHSVEGASVRVDTRSTIQPFFSLGVD
jgi:hypothetical protein